MAATATSAASSKNWSADDAWTISGVGTASGADGVLSSGVLTPTVSPTWTVGALVGRRIKLDSTWYSISANTATTLTITSPPADATYAYLLGGSPIAGDAVIIADGGVITLDVNTAALASLTAAGNTGYITSATSQTINLGTGSGITYGGTSTSGFIRQTANKLTVLVGGTVTSAVNGTLAGPPIVGSGSGSVTITNTGNTAITTSNNCRGLSMGGTGSWNITGDLKDTGGGIALYASSSGTASTWDGNAVNSGGGYALSMSNGTAIWTPQAGTSIACSGTGSGFGVYVSGGTLNISGSVSTSNTSTSASIARLLHSIGGTINWTGVATLGAGADCVITLNGGTINLATASAALALANSGNFLIHKQAGTLNVVNGGNVATVTKQTNTATQAVIGAGAVAATFLVDPTLPAAVKVDTSQGNYGYAGALTTPTLNMALYTLLTTVTSTLNTNKDEMIAANDSIKAAYGCDTGTAPAGYTYGDSSAAKVLTTATGAGMYQPVATADVKKGVAVGVSPAVGTLEGIIDSAGNVTTVGCLVSGTQYPYGTVSDDGAYNPTGVIFGTGSYATEASRNTDPGVAYVLTDHNYKIAGVDKTAAYSPDFPSPGNVTNNDTTNGVTGELDLGQYLLITDVVSTLNANTDEMIAANDSLQAAFGCDAGTAPAGGTYTDAEIAAAIWTYASRTLTA